MSKRAVPHESPSTGKTNRKFVSGNEMVVALRRNRTKTMGLWHGAAATIRTGTGNSSRIDNLNSVPTGPPASWARSLAHAVVRPMSRRGSIHRTIRIAVPQSPLNGARMIENREVGPGSILEAERARDAVDGARQLQPPGVGRSPEAPGDFGPGDAVAAPFGELQFFRGEALPELHQQFLPGDNLARITGGGDGSFRRRVTGSRHPPGVAALAIVEPRGGGEFVAGHRDQQAEQLRQVAQVELTRGGPDKEACQHGLADVHRIEESRQPLIFEVQADFAANERFVTADELFRRSRVPGADAVDEFHECRRIVGRAGLIHGGTRGPVSTSGAPPCNPRTRSASPRNCLSSRWICRLRRAACRSCQ